MALNLNIVYTLIVLLFNIFIPYTYFYISKSSNIPYKNFPLISRIFLKVMSKFIKFNIYPYHRYKNQRGNTLLTNFLDIIPEFV